MLTRLVFAIADKELQENLEKSLNGSDIQIECYGKNKNAWQNVGQSCADIIVISESLIPRPVESGIATLNNLPEAPTTVILHNFDSSEEHAQLMAAGADVVLYSGVLLKTLIETIETTLESRRQLIQLDMLDRRSPVRPKLSDFLSSGETMQIFINDVKQVTLSDSIILLLGETGVGKEHLAKAIHAESHRSSGPFIALNTAALPEQLLESELFGHTRGAFTGATRSRRGAFELAHGGTIFLDEIGEMPLHLQAKLLRVLQDYEVRPVGGEKSVWVDVRVIAATNRDLEEDVASGLFRKDLFFRLNVMTLKIPPLREHSEDVPSLARRFINYYRYKIDRDISTISEAAMASLCRYEWPGNVRELMNVIERALLICKTGTIGVEDLPSVFNLSDPQGAGSEKLSLPIESWHNRTLPQVQNEVMDQVEVLYLKMILKEHRGRINNAAKAAGIHSRSLFNKMKRLGIRKEDYR